MNDGTETTPATRILSNFATIATPEGELQLVDFEQFDNNEGYPGSLFTSVEPPRTVGIATFNGGQLLNETTKVTVTYTVQDVNGEIETTVELDSNVNSGAATVALPGDGITQVIITPTGEFGSWDFLIDNVQFRP